ncbi:hypothetical protein RJ639_045614 [Escallonia herrerae]|uniref:Uncharacterized protein n=1 Tax=Escallonia herrerae TaxID=1293975 RepID=A0AA88WA57_9ASTE|nr:hypothetical protein RJ639_045614 [Escallonia herrerae]
MAALLGDDGRGYELAHKLESHGVWRPWLGDSLYSTFVQSLSSPSSRDDFMRADDSRPRTQIHLQLRARALLFDKACVSLFLRSDSAPSSVTISNLNPNYLQLHGDDVYFTLENSSRDGVVATNTSSVKAHPKQVLVLDRGRYGESEVDRPQRLRVLEKHKRRRVAFNEDQHISFGTSMFENGSNVRSNSLLDNNAVDEAPFFPETMFMVNFVPDSALPRANCVEDNLKVKFNGVLDNLPQIMTRSPIMIERLGIRPEYLSVNQGGNQSRGKSGAEGNRKSLGQEQALQMSRKVIARLLTSVGFEASSEVPMEVFSQLLSCHICKLDRILKVLADSYKKQYSAMELLKMFLQTVGYK